MHSTAIPFFIVSVILIRRFFSKRDKHFSSDKVLNQLIELELATTLQNSIYALVKLKIPDILEHGSFSASQIAKLTNTKKDYLKRFLDYLVAHKIIKKNHIEKYTKTEFSYELTTSHPYTKKYFILMECIPRRQAALDITKSLLEIEPFFDNESKQDYWSYLATDQEKQQVFDKGMNIITTEEHSIIANFFTKQKFSSIADIGGRDGSLLKKIKSTTNLANKKKFILLEQEKFISHIIKKDPEIECVSFNLLDPLPIKSDAFIITRYLHNWNDEIALSILKNASKALNPDGRVFIIEGVLDLARNPQLLRMIDLKALVIANGKERTFDELKNLCLLANLEIVLTQEITSTVYIIECKKVILEC